MFNIKKRLLKTGLKIILGVTIAISVFMFVFISTEGDAFYFFNLSPATEDSRENVGKVFYRLLAGNDFQPAPEEEKAPSTGSRGSGLNLLLINNIQTEGYVKEMLELYRDSEEGKLSSSEYHLALRYLIGMQVNETGFYSLPNIDGGKIPSYIPKSYIPIENNEIQWGKSYKGFTGDSMRIKQINSNMINSIINGTRTTTSDDSKLPYTINGINPPMSDGGWSDVNVFQIRHTYFQRYGGNSPPSLLNGYNSATGRPSDPFYVPDNLSYLDATLSGMAKLYSIENLPKNDTLLALMYSINHNGGSGVLQYKASFGVPSGSGSAKVKQISAYKEEYHKSYNDLVEDFTSYGKNFQVEKTYTSGTNARVYAVFGLLSEGWKLSPEAYSKMTTTYDRYIEPVYRSMFGSDKNKADAIKYLQENVKAMDISDIDSANVYGLDNIHLDYNEAGHGSLYKIENRTSPVYKNKYANGDEPKVVHVLNVVNVGHIHSTLFTGGPIYGIMLKYAGVGIDPTNPEEYLKPYREDGEWAPSGETDWIKSYDIDTSILTTEAIRALNEGKKWLGHPYAWGGKGEIISQQSIDSISKQYPSYASKYKTYLTGSMGKRMFDCSGYTWFIYKESFSINIGAGTGTQIDSSYLKTIEEDEAKPGDLVYVGSLNNPLRGIHHVVVFLKDAGNKILVMHAPQTGDVVKIAYYPKGGLTYKRYSGMYSD